MHNMPWKKANVSSNGAKGCFPVENTFPATSFSPCVLHVNGFDVAPLKKPKMSLGCGENPIHACRYHALPCHAMPCVPSHAACMAARHPSQTSTMPWVCCRRRNQWLRLALASFVLLRCLRGACSQRLIMRAYMDFVWDRRLWRGWYHAMPCHVDSLYPPPPAPSHAPAARTGS